MKKALMKLAGLAKALQVYDEKGSKLEKEVQALYTKLYEAADKKAEKDDGSAVTDFWGGLAHELEDNLGEPELGYSDLKKYAKDAEKLAKNFDKDLAKAVKDQKKFEADQKKEEAEAKKRNKEMAQPHHGHPDKEVENDENDESAA